MKKQKPTAGAKHAGKKRLKTIKDAKRVNTRKKYAPTRKKLALDFVIITFASVLYAFGVSAFVNPGGIIAGGITGISTMLHHATSLSFSMFYGLLNLPLLLTAFLKLGRMTTVKSIWAVAVTTTAADLVPFPSYDVDNILCSIFGGVLLGASTGLIYSREGTSGGFDIVSKLLNRLRPDLSVGSIAIGLNACIVFAGMLQASSDGVSVALYSLIFFFVNGRMTDFILYGGGQGKLLMIFSDKYAEISDIIMTELNRGVTLLDGRGAYSGEERKVIACVVQKHQHAKLKNICERCDPHAFIVACDASEIVGRGFTLPMNG